MGNTNSTNDKIRDFFNDSKLKNFGNKLGSVFGKFVTYGENMMNNFMKLSNNMSTFLSSNYLPYILIFCGGVFIAIRLKLI